MIWRELALVLASVFGIGFIAWTGFRCGRTGSIACRMGEVQGRWMSSGMVQRRSPIQFWWWVAHYAFGAILCAFGALVLLMALVAHVGLFTKGLR